MEEQTYIDLVYQLGLSCSNCGYVLKYRRYDTYSAHQTCFFCSRHPQLIQKKDSDWCGDHSVLEARRSTRCGAPV